MRKFYASPNHKIFALFFASLYNNLQMPAFGYSAKHPDYIEPPAETLKPSYLRKLPYHPRAQFCGTLTWLCAACGKISRARLAPQLGLRIECGGHGCNAPFFLGFVFYQIPKGFRLSIDAGLPLDPFPQAETDYLPRGAAANRVVYSIDNVNI